MNSLICLTAVAVVGSMGGVMKDQAESEPIAPARSGDIAIHEELCAARRQGTVAAYDLFIARHPAHPLAELAKQERAKMIRGD